jgi:hypothetical protein
MFGRETRMLLRHYLEQGASKCALAPFIAGFETGTWIAIRRRRPSSAGHDRPS